jgi:hypothetical protein
LVAEPLEDEELEPLFERFSSATFDTTKRLCRDQTSSLALEHYWDDYSL